MTRNVRTHRPAVNDAWRRTVCDPSLRRQSPSDPADDLLLDLGRAAVDRLDAGVQVRLGDGVLGHVAVAAVQLHARGRRACSGARWSTTSPSTPVAASSSPRTCRATQSSTKTRAMCASVAISASRNRLCWNLPIGVPKAVAVLGVVQATARATSSHGGDRRRRRSRAAPGAGSSSARRSRSPPRRAGSPSAPGRRRRTARRCPGRAGRSCRGCGRARSPSMPRSTTSSEMPWWPASGSVRATTIDQVGQDAVGDEGLLAVEHVVVARVDGRGADALQVGAGARLGHRDRGDQLARAQAGQPALLLLRRSRCAARYGDDHVVEAAVNAAAVDARAGSSPRRAPRCSGSRSMPAAAVLLGRAEARAGPARRPCARPRGRRCRRPPTARGSGTTSLSRKAPTLAAERLVLGLEEGARPVIRTPSSLSCATCAAGSSLDGHDREVGDAGLAEGGDPLLDVRRGADQVGAPPATRWAPAPRPPSSCRRR